MDAHARRDGLWHQVLIGEGGQVDEPHAIGILVTNQTSDLQREARLAHTAGTCERQQRDVGQQPLDFDDLLPPADECGELEGQVVGDRAWTAQVVEKADVRWVQDASFANVGSLVAANT